MIIPLFIFWGALALLIGYLWRKFVGERAIKAAEERAREIIREAENIALTKKKELDIQTKETLYRLRSEFEKETRNKRKELQFLERRLNQREILLEKKAELLEKRESEIAERELRINEKEQQIKQKIQELESKIELEVKKLEEISGMTREQARDTLVKVMEQEARTSSVEIIRKIEAEAREIGHKKAREILLSAMQRLASESATESTVSVVSLPNDEIKGRIIGREGRNIRAFESATGVDLIVDDTPQAITISSFNIYRREIARIALEKLIADGRIHPGRIEEVVQKTTKEMEEQLVEEGKNVAFDLGVENLNPEIIKLIGRLRYRTSFGQNVLQHAKESAFLAGIIASEIGLNPKIAKRAALLHDIGKALDQEVEGSHPEIGADILKKYGEPQEVIDAAMHHHKDLDIASPYTVIVQIADALSATRPGARRDTLESYLRRVEELEKIGASFKGVDQAYAISAGREIRVIVKPDEISDQEAMLLARDIARKIEGELKYIGQVKVTVIREKRETEFAR
ncbi:MAG: ribonuclease Y [Candidatus Omnitrophica bacterium]|nr:ribonuclease Y [Candidatus Omnitrophota bacterium]MCM8825719.1 ribonuclease Y [Candidatus Omnitrophota bacterium]